MSPHSPQPPSQPPFPPLPPGWAYRRQRRLTGGQITGIVVGSAFLLLMVLALIGSLMPDTPSTPSGGSALVAAQGTSTTDPGALVSSPQPVYTPAPVVTAPAPTSTKPAHTAAPTHTPAPTHSPKPTHSAKPTPKPSPGLCGAPANPWGFNLCGRGGKITASQLPSGVCNYFDCIGNFYNGRGDMVECNDGTYSMSGGIRGACSDHKGEGPFVYSG